MQHVQNVGHTSEQKLQNYLAGCVLRVDMMELMVNNMKCIKCGEELPPGTEMTMHLECAQELLRQSLGLKKVDSD